MRNREKSSGVAVFAWSLYDFANTIFAVSILTVYFPLWISELSDSEGIIVNAATAFSALLVLVSAPLLGAVADLRQRRIPYLILLTLLSVALTGMMGFVGLLGGDGPGWVLVAGVGLFVAADLTYQAALVFYNALLPGVASGRGAGRVSGYGTAFGYVGSISALLVLGFAVARGDEVRAFLAGTLPGISPSASSSDAFVPTAVLFLLFSLPTFLLVPDRVPGDNVASGVSRVGVREAYRAVVSTLRGLRNYTGMGTFLFATLLYTDAANTAVANVALYGRVVFGMDARAVTALLLFSTVFAIVGSFVFGFLSDRSGPKRALLAVIVIWLVSIVMVATAPTVAFMYAAGPLVGVALGATWTVSRPMLIALSPPEKLGEFFGLFTFAGKVSAVAGPAATAVLLYLFADLGGLAYRISIGSLAVIMVLAFFLMLRVPDARPEGGTG
ncbi:MFS transporter [Rubrobacter indicoceani]|uniref:MFS transporter n=1 Tax=Rubrobacter indicoceani TaxID=2051957 RepID=UPI000E5BCDDF|nr:MFS transporter [Rubrobacter indicoceani]